jgi:hypothetical protein
MTPPLLESNKSPRQLIIPKNQIWRLFPPDHVYRLQYGCSAGRISRRPGNNPSQRARSSDTIHCNGSWLTLAGYVVLPNTFTSLGNSSSLDGTAGGKAIQDAVRNVQLLPLAGVLCCLGTAGSCWLWWKWQKNYIWLISRIFL